MSFTDPGDPRAESPGGVACRVRELVLQAEEGTQSIEYLLILAFAVVPCFWAILLLLDVLREVLGLETVLLTSPFF